MTKLKFRAGGEAWEAGEPVFHCGLREFATVAGISGGKVIIERGGRSGDQYGADPVMLRRDADGAAAFAKALGSINGRLSGWLRDSLADGLNVADCRDALREAARL